MYVETEKRNKGAKLGSWSVGEIDFAELNMEDKRATSGERSVSIPRLTLRRGGAET